MRRPDVVCLLNVCVLNVVCILNVVCAVLPGLDQLGLSGSMHSLNNSMHSAQHQPPPPVSIDPRGGGDPHLDLRMHPQAAPPPHHQQPDPRGYVHTVCARKHAAGIQFFLFLCVILRDDIVFFFVPNPLISSFFL